MPVSLKTLNNAKLGRQVATAYARDGLPSVRQLCLEFGLTEQAVRALARKNLPRNEYTELKRLRYSRSKRGANNPMLGKKGREHHNFKGVVKDGKGYLMVLKPDWYTGRKGVNHIFQHHDVFCRALGITAIPEGFAVHHINGDQTDNRVENLALVTHSAHSRIHHYTPRSEKLSAWELHEFMTWKSSKTPAT